MNDNSTGFSGDIPSNYDRDLGPIIFAGYAADMAQRVVSDRAQTVLETAAGSGIVTRALRDALPAGAHLTATDLNPDMLDVARTKFHADEQVDFRQADAAVLPFPDGSFDTVMCQFGVMFFPDKDQGYNEAHRVLTQGGRLLFSVWDAHRHNAFGRIAHETIGSFFTDNPPSFYAVPFGYNLIDPIKESLLAAGFEKIVFSVVQQQRPVADLSAFANGIVFGNPVIDQIRERGGVEPAEVQKAITAAMRREFGAEPTTISIQEIVFEARKL
jgi:ubiquinone/menaquinone biosynthesis C-methylase UbiE